ncbi:exodeoxyribonuclease VII small subunit [Helicobacter sp. 23-1044]
MSEKDNIHFEDRIAKIKQIIDKLNSTEITLKDGMQLYKDGVDEINEAQKMLESAKNLYDEINKKEGNK